MIKIWDLALGSCVQTIMINLLNRRAFFARPHLVFGPPAATFPPTTGASSYPKKLGTVNCRRMVGKWVGVVGMP